MTLSDLGEVLAPWLAVPITALDFGLAWSRLPERVPMQFGHHGQVTWAASRGEALAFDLGVLAAVLALTTVLALATAASNPEKARTARVVTALVVGLQTAVFNVVLWKYQVA